MTAAQRPRPASGPGALPARFRCSGCRRTFKHVGPAERHETTSGHEVFEDAEPLDAPAVARTDAARTVEVMSTETTQPTTPTTSPAWWILLERQYNNDAAVGPYPDESTANLAMQSSLNIDAMCEEDCLGATLEYTDPDDTWERFIVDLTDPTFLGS